MNGALAADQAPVRPDAESQLASLLVAVVLLDPAGRVADANPAAEALLGLSLRRMMGQQFTRIAHFDDTRIAAALGDADTPFAAHGVSLVTTATVTQIDLASAPLSDGLGWRTVTLTKARPQRDEPTAQSQMRTPAILAHEIKNPLAAIRGAGQLLARRLGSDNQSLTGIIAAEVDRIANIVDRMQQLGTRARSTESCNAHEIIRSTIASVRAARGDQIMISEAFDPSLPNVIADPIGLAQVLINLLTNAADACAEAEAPGIEVATRFVAGPMPGAASSAIGARGAMEIAVTDNGPGIDPNVATHIFEPFVSSKPHGQGLGLALVHKLVRDMGGRITHDRDCATAVTAFRLHLALDLAATA